MPAQKNWDQSSYRDTGKETISWLRLEGNSGDYSVQVPAQSWVNHKRVAWYAVQSCFIYLRPGPVLNHPTKFYYYV